jgi:type IV pilus assembly protein PilC
MDRTGEFPSILINMIAAGEASGSLEIAFDRMATHFEKDARIKGMVKKAMIYPAVVLVVMIAVIIIMMVLVIPNFVGMFADMGTELPPLTKFVMAASDFVVNRWYILVLIVAVVVFSYKVFSSGEYGKHVIARVTLSIPIFGDMVTKTACSRFSRTLSTLMAAGMSLIEAIDITAKTMDNLLYKEALMDTKEEVAKGIPLSQPLIDTGLFPAMICQMTQIGEETGNIEEMLNKCADYYDEEVELATQSLSAAMEPIIIVVMAGVVGVVVMAVMQPMFTMYSAMDNM